MKGFWIVVGVIIVIVLAIVLYFRNGSSLLFRTGPTPSPIATTTPVSSVSPTAALSGQPSPQNQNVNIGIQNSSFNPGSVTIKKGTTVMWKNNDNVVHTITSNTGAFDSGSLQGGQTFSFTFNQTGTFSYHCSIHPSMRGAIIVTQ